MNSQELETLKIEITKVVKETVNGKVDRLDKKIDEHNTQHELDMKRILPIIEAYEASEKFALNARKNGATIIKAVMYVSAFVTAVGSAYLILRNIFHLN